MSVRILRFEIFLCTLVFSGLLKPSPMFSQEEFGQEDMHPPQSSFINVSLFGLLSTSMNEYDTTDHNLCIGVIHCGNRSLNGLGISLLANTTNGSSQALLLAYFGNISFGDSAGMHLALLANYNQGTFSGVQGSFLTGVNWGDFTGLQIAAIAYTDKSFSGLQAGLGNYAGYLGGLLQAGVFNIVARQSPGGEDRDDKEKRTVPFGFQLGILNYSRDPEVVPVGLINIIYEGRISFALERDLFGYNRLAIVSGSKYFYYRFYLPDLGNWNEVDLFKNEADMEVHGEGISLRFPVYDDFHGLIDYNRIFYNDYKVNEVREINMKAEWNYLHLIYLEGGLSYSTFQNDLYDPRINESKTSLGLSFAVSLNFLWGMR